MNGLYLSHQNFKMKKDEDMSMISENCAVVAGNDLINFISLYAFVVSDIAKNNK